MIRIKRCCKWLINTCIGRTQFSINFFRNFSVSKLVNNWRRKIETLKRQMSVVTDCYNWSIFFFITLLYSERKPKGKKAFHLRLNALISDETSFVPSCWPTTKTFLVFRSVYKAMNLQREPLSRSWDWRLLFARGTQRKTKWFSIHIK